MEQHNLLVLLLLLAPIMPTLFFTDAFDFKALKKSPDENKAEGKQITFDEQGILSIHGSFGGISEPIVVDKKPLQRGCSVRPYYVFSVCPENKTALKVHNKVCNEGITFCYEGQLVEGRVNEQYVLPKKQNEVSKKCKEFNGFKIAIHQFNDTLENGENQKLFMEIKTSYMDEALILCQKPRNVAALIPSPRYYFAVPESRCMDLYLGNLDNILAGVRTVENNNKLVQPHRVWLNRTQRVGIYYEKGDNSSAEEEFEAAFDWVPDVENNERYADHAHMNMLYMDFRARLLSPQMMMAVVPDKDCNMLVRVRGNVVQSCKSNWKQRNFALRSLNDNQTSTQYALTIESGTEEWKTTGRKSGKSKSTSESKETGSSTTTEDSTTSSLQREEEHVQRSSNTHTETSGKEESSKQTVGGHVSAGAGTSQASIEAKLEMEKSWEQSNGYTDTYQRYTSRMSMRSSSETSVTSNSQILETAYKSTTTSMNTQKSQSINSETVGVSKKTKFKWIVNVPPGKTLVPLQMTLSCDGEQVKIPWIRFQILKDGEELPAPDY